MRVLIVDDDDDVRSFLEATVRVLGVTEIRAASSGEEALAAVIHGRFDLVTLDIKMPGVSGLDIISVVRGMMPTSVIAIVSGYADEVSGPVFEHADLFLAKPVHIEVLKELVDRTRELTAARERIRELSDAIPGVGEGA